MPDLDLTAANTSFSALRPIETGEWPPRARLLEADPKVAAALTALGTELDQVPPESRAVLFRALQEAVPGAALRAVLGQLGAARLFQIIHWIASHGLPEGSRLIAAVIAGDGRDAQALRAAVGSVTRRVALDRMFSPDRIAALDAAATAALKEVN